MICHGIQFQLLSKSQEKKNQKLFKAKREFSFILCIDASNVKFKLFILYSIKKKIYNTMLISSVVFYYQQIFSRKRFIIFVKAFNYFHAF